MDRRKRPSRAAFTLIEILIVVVIIAILIGLLVPAVIAAVGRAREAQVLAEMNNMATALASFKNLNGDYPPSRVILCEAGYTNYLNSLSAAQQSAPVGPLPSPIGSCTDLSVAQLVARSQIYMSRFWPRADFNNGTVPFDFNNNGSFSDVIVLTGSECLTFFLGGIPINNNNGTYSMSGFSKSPVNPFQNNILAVNRSVPQYEFVSGRLHDQDGDHMPSYIDPLNTTPGSIRTYAYFFSYGANAYDPNDDNGYGRANDTSDANNDFEHDDNASTVNPPYGSVTEWGFLVGFPTTSGTAPYSAVSPSPNPYTSGPSSSGNVAWINPTTFQIICSGKDGLFGMGGTYQGTSGTGGTLPLLLNDTGNVNGIGNRVRENDNLTNFSGGRLN